MDVSVIVLSWEDVQHTSACVRSLPPGAEIVVVDNGSSAQVGSGLRELCEETGARYVRADTNLGYARGMNLGVRHTTRSTVILSNNDIVVHPDAVARLVARLDDPAVGAAFPKVHDMTGADRTAAGRFLTIPVGVGHATGLAIAFRRLRIVTTPEQADWLSGPFVAIRRQTLDDIGGVDESSHFYSEDLRLCWALRQRGLRLAYVPEAVVTHEDDASAKRRWSMEEISRRQTRELLRATHELAGWRGYIAGTAYAAGALVRAGLGGAVRRAVARGAVEGLRSR